jgi:hypothetical protein
MGITEYLSLIYRGHMHAICYVYGAFILIIMYAFFKRGRGIPKPKKEDIWPWVKKILNYFENR